MVARTKPTDDTLEECDADLVLYDRRVLDVLRQLDQRVDDLEARVSAIERVVGFGLGDERP
jgi:hypothetical protein